MATTARKSAQWKAKGWTSVPNSIIRTPDLSFELIGLVAWIASHDEEFEFTARAIAERTSAGYNKVDALVRELEHRGYLTRQRQRNNLGVITGIVYELHPEPVPTEQNTWVPPRTPRARRPHPGSKAAQAEERETAGQSHFMTRHSMDRHSMDRHDMAGHELSKEEKTNKKKDPSSSVGSSAARTRSVGMEGGGGEGEKPQSTDDAHRSTAEAVVDALPAVGRSRVGASLRATLVTEVAARLAAGWSAEGVSAELTRDLASARSTGVYVHRLAELPADPPRRVPVEPAVGVRPDWCGGCDERTRQRVTDDGAPYRCPQCHPLAAVRPAESAVAASDDRVSIPRQDPRLSALLRAAVGSKR